MRPQRGVQEVGGLTELTQQDQLCDVKLCSLLCLSWSPFVANHCSKKPRVLSENEWQKLRLGYGTGFGVNTSPRYFDNYSLFLCSKSLDEF